MKRYFVVTVFFTLVLFLFANFLHAKESLALTITPPLFQLTIAPGEFWSSEIKLINTNPYDLELYATVMNFEAKGEGGKGSFSPLVNEDVNDPKKSTYSLGSWIEISKKPIFIRSGETVRIPFSVKIPKNAEPGGHYAAILVGTSPQEENGNGPLVKVSSFVSSLLFVRIEGDIVENGRIREFSTKKSFYQNSESDFVLRFENLGNVHLKPQGDIVIYNMWGKERGKIDINQKSNFGNVLPNQTRKFEFSWRGEDNIFEIGRYSAISTLAYGEDGRKNISAKTYFWVVPIVPVFTVLGILGFLLLIIVWFIKRYIKRALMMEAELLKKVNKKEPEKSISIQTLTRPLKQGIVDLRNINNLKKESDDSEAKTQSNSLTLVQFLKKYFLFFIFISVLIVGIFFLWIYFGEVLLQERNFNISVKEDVLENVK